MSPEDLLTADELRRNEIRAWFDRRHPQREMQRRRLRARIVLIIADRRAS